MLELKAVAVTMVRADGSEMHVHFAGAVEVAPNDTRGAEVRGDKKFSMAAGIAGPRRTADVPPANP